MSPTERPRKAGAALYVCQTTTGKRRGLKSCTEFIHRQ